MTAQQAKPRWRDAQPPDVATEILAIYRQFALVWDADDRLPALYPGYQWCSSPEFFEAGIPALIILDELGARLSPEDQRRADEYNLQPLLQVEGVGDLPAPRTGAELEELKDRIQARIEAVAWETATLARLRQWLQEGPERGTRVHSALRNIADFGCGKHHGFRD